jgi:flagellar hook assembly protein FlgD
LGGIYPNPFHAFTTIEYSLKVAGDVSIAVYDVKGRLVRQLVQTNNPGGSFTTHWDGTDAAGKQMSNGIYYLSMQSDAYRASRKLLLLK